MSRDAKDFVAVLAVLFIGLALLVIVTDGSDGPTSCEKHNGVQTTLYNTDHNPVYLVCRDGAKVTL